MAVELTPPGSRGARFPTLPSPVVKAALGLLYLALRLARAPLLKLTTRGAKSGRVHSVPLLWFPAGDGAWLIVGSFGGAAHHPAWYVNMARNPDQVLVEIGKRRLRVQPATLQGTERAEAWGRIVAKVPMYAAYQAKTDRQIPVVRLSPQRE